MLNKSLFRLSKRRLCGLFLIGLLTTLGIYAPTIKSGIDFQQYRNLSNEISPLIREMSDTPPADVDPIIWSDVVNTTDTAFGSIFFNSEHASFAELQSFANDLRRSADLEPSAKMKWIWKRLE